MEAKTMLPRGQGIKTLMVERDAVVSAYGENAVFVCVGTQAKKFPVKITGYSGSMAGIESSGLEEGMKVVVKGNERLMDGQRLEILPVDTRFYTNQ